MRDKNSVTDTDKGEQLLHVCSAKWLRTRFPSLFIPVLEVWKHKMKELKQCCHPLMLWGFQGCDGRRGKKRSWNRDSQAVRLNRNVRIKCISEGVVYYVEVYVVYKVKHHEISVAKEANHLDLVYSSAQGLTWESLVGERIYTATTTQITLWWQRTDQINAACRYEIQKLGATLKGGN